MCDTTGMYDYKIGICSEYNYSYDTRLHGLQCMCLDIS